ncbi:hypothetical protein, conserved [Trypanosoma brucei gambiense DAL972]|uniref:Uncharacterized protein n=1 Tax=Trypanosoma brucei gambiense (strain MHOM/CI/86/DAL972) TaxID=679716 RepID=C9ZNR9_TRYB9|nr:hypothetical protein, conserved [Trypanosoma brucei gambiense DAL972]CBH11047.1 hypothetical protein, conserved [Trypanosoma brucei gambiense DAL972]|eukprot:XP_011773334.1 hypothetical protein, conserved [Trypanosoma brucei gambiense DAL972]
MRWAFSRGRITSTELLQLLQKHQENIDAQSVFWLSEAQAKYHYRLQCRGGVEVPRDMLPRPAVYSIIDYSPSERRSLLQSLPLLAIRDHKWLLLTKNCMGSEPFAWKAATLEQYVGALLTSPASEANFDGTLLVDASVAVPSRPQPSVQLFNAQETSNPFLADDSLRHTHLITGKPFPHGVSSALSTLWSQFSYTSMRWLPIDDDDATNLDSLTLNCNQEPHAVFDPEPVQLVCIGQLVEEEQASILHSAPRWVLEHSLKRPIILSNGKWMTWRKMELDEDVRLPCTATARWRSKCQPPPQHQIWLRITNNIHHTGAPLQRCIMHRRLFYNSSQIAV